jgi:hypothetical protein
MTIKCNAQIAVSQFPLGFVMHSGIPMGDANMILKFSNSRGMLVTANGKIYRQSSSEV